MLDDKDFIRLSLTTKQIKIIQRIQLQYQDETTEWLEDDLSQNVRHVAADVTIHTDSYSPAAPVLPSVSTASPTSAVLSDKAASSDPVAPAALADDDQPYKGISLDDV